jgi:hypothetical protein
MILPEKNSKNEPALEWAVGQPLIMGEKSKKPEPDPEPGVKAKKAKRRVKTGRKTTR